MVRQPAFAGQFYPDDSETLRKMVEDLYRSEDGPQEFLKGQSIPPLLGVVSPHAGYVYSGAIAAWSFGALAMGTVADTWVILGPSHRGGKARAALSGMDYWQTPLGRVPVDQEGNRFLLSQSSLYRIDDQAHSQEHSIEVQIPFLQVFFPGPQTILPISLGDQGMEVALELSRVLTEFSRKKPIAIIASSDFTHYESARTARAKDLPLIELIDHLQIDEFYRFLNERQVSVCGPGSLAVLAGTQKKLSGLPGRLLHYTNSGAVSGDFERVVGYASIIFPQTSDF